MSEEMMINMIANCAKMEAALQLLQTLIMAGMDEGYTRVDMDDLNTVLMIAGMEQIKKEEPQTVEE